MYEYILLDSMSDLNLIFDREFKIATKALKINKSHPYEKRDILWKIQVFMSYFVTVTCLICLIYSMLYHDFPEEDYGEGVKNGMIVIVATSILLKYFILTRNRHVLIKLIKMIEDDYEIAKRFNNEDRSTVLKYNQKGKEICKIWLVIATGASMMFPLKAAVLMAYYYNKGEFRPVAIFDIHYPEFINAHKYEPLVYFLLFLLVFSFDCFAMSMYVAFDPLVPIFMLHTCGQLHILSQRILNVFSQNSEPEEISENLKQINIKLESIYRFVKTVQNVFSVQYEYNLKTTTFLIPFAGFQLAQSLVKREFNLEFLFFFVGAILHFYIPCCYSDLLMEKSEVMRQAIYSSGWENTTNTKNRKIVLFMLTRTTMPLVIRTVFFPICLDTFAQMCRQSYAIYNIISAAWAQ